MPVCVCVLDASDSSPLLLLMTHIGLELDIDNFIKLLSQIFSRVVFVSTRNCCRNFGISERCIEGAAASGWVASEVFALSANRLL